MVQKDVNNKFNIEQLSFDDNIVNSIEFTINNKNTLNILSIPPLLTILTLPYKKLKNPDGSTVTNYEKTIVKNDVTYLLSIKSGYDHKAKSNHFYGIPYGIYSRLLLYYICSVVIRLKTKEVHLGNSYKEILENIQIMESNLDVKSQIKASGSQIRELKNQIDRLLNAQIIASRSMVVSSGEGDNIKNNEENTTNFINLIDQVKHVKFWNEESDKEDEGYVVRLTDNFYNLIVEQGSTIFDYNLVKKLKNSPIAMDLALFLNYYAYNTMRFNKDFFISYKDLFLQFGSNSPQKEFNRMIKKALKQVCSLMPNLYIKIDVTRNKEKGLLLLNISKPMISSKLDNALEIQKEQQITQVEKEIDFKSMENTDFLNDDIPFKS